MFTLNASNIITAKIAAVIAVTLTVLAGCHSASLDSPSASSQTAIDSLAAQLQVKYQVLANRGGGHCTLPTAKIKGENNSGSNPCFEVSLALTAQDAIPQHFLQNNWAIYFSQVDPLLAQEPGEFDIRHINGDLHRITPNKRFKGFRVGERKTLQFVVRGLNLTEAKLMPNYYVVGECLAKGCGAAASEARVIESTRLVIDSETGLETRPYAAPIAADQFKMSPNDKTSLATSGFIYQQNKAFQAGSDNPVATASHQVIPTPLNIRNSGSELNIAAGLSLSLTGVTRPELAAALERLQLLGVSEFKGGENKGVPLSIVVDAAFRLKGTANQKPGRYQLSVLANSIEITAADSDGAFYGLSSLASLVNVGSNLIPTVFISDQPRYDYRGMHVDVGRNFHSKTFLIDLMDQMAAYKLNKLHLHLGEDEGWRLEIPDLPELTDVGSKRCHDPQENNCLLMQLGADVSGEGPLDGFYSRADYIELVAAAHARHIQLIPSFDMPGHSRAVIKSMEARYRKYMAKGDKARAVQYLLSDLNDKTVYQSIQYYSDNTINACMESPYEFLSKVIDEVKAMHLEAGQPLTVYHIGADETAGAWKDSPICQDFFASNPHGVTSEKDLGAYFIQRVAHLLLEKNIQVAGWSDGLSHTDARKMPKKVQSNIWDVLPWAGVAEANKQANRGWDVVLSTPDALYFDFPYEPSPKEGGLYWATRHINTQKVFNFMPGNLAAMAEVYKGTDEQDFEIKDTAPLQKGVSWAGIQGQIWSETIRSDEAVEYAVFPRLLALAERAWHQPEWELPYRFEGETYNANSGHFNDTLKTQRDAAWQDFASTLGYKELAKLDAANIQYRVPTVGAVIENGVLSANLAYPGLGIEYRVNQGEWNIFNGPVAVQGTVEVRAIAADGKRRGRILNAGSGH